MKFKANGFAILFLSIILISCSSVPESTCPENPPPGNIGSPVNSRMDEYSPLIRNMKLYYGRKVVTPEKTDPYVSEMTGSGFSLGLPDSLFMVPLQKVEGSGTVSIHRISENSMVMYFAGFSSEGRKKHSDIYHSFYDGSIWTEPEPVPGKVNTPGYESHPSISRDGSVLFFTSDRKGSFGETDIFYSTKDENGAWTTPVNPGNQINTGKKEMFPYIDDEGNIYYASQGYSENGSYQIMKSGFDPESGWQKAISLDAPVNSNYDDICPFIYGDYIFFSSNRPGGCGGYDIYRFNRCGPVIAEGIIEGLSSNMPLHGKVKIYQQGKEEYTMEVDESGTFELPLNPNSKYKMKYTNPCIPDFTAVQEFTTPCSDTSSVKIKVNFRLPEFLNEYTFEEYNVPFFVSGYYLPNTPENLEALRMKFAYNLIGNHDSTRYIENPGEEYDKYAVIVQEALNEAITFVKEKLDYFDSKCIDENDRMNITVEGFSDPRIISEAAKYDGPEVDDPKYSFHVDRGASMNNELLSKLRAYFTAKYIEQVLMKNAEFQLHMNRISWNIKGRGVDERDVIENELKRRVAINIAIETR